MSCCSGHPRRAVQYSTVQYSVQCRVAVDTRGVHIPGQGEYGYCPASCQRDILTTPPPPSTIPPSTAPPPLTAAPPPQWGSWSECSAQCGGGTQLRANTRCPAGSSGCASQQTRGCNTRACAQPPAASPPPPPAASGWTSWSPCSASCGGGTQLRTRRGTNIAQTQGCNIHPCSSSSSRPAQTEPRPPARPARPAKPAVSPARRPARPQSQVSGPHPGSARPRAHGVHPGGGRPRAHGM